MEYSRVPGHLLILQAHDAVARFQAEEVSLFVFEDMGYSAEAAPAGILRGLWIPFSQVQVIANLEVSIIPAQVKRLPARGDILKLLRPAFQGMNF